MELVDVPAYQTTGAVAAGSNGPSSGGSGAAMPPPVGVPAPKAAAAAGAAAGVPNTNETDEPPNSSPARSSAAMALASMFHIKPGACVCLSPCFPIDVSTSHAFPSVDTCLPSSPNNT